MEWACSRHQTVRTYKVLVGKSDSQKTPVRSRRRWEYVTTSLTETGSKDVEWIQMTQDWGL